MSFNSWHCSVKLEKSRKLAFPPGVSAGNNGNIILKLKAHNLRNWSLLGARTRDPTHDKVMRRRPDKQGRSGPQGFRKGAHLKDDLCLMLAILDYSLISVTQVDGLPRSLSKQNQLRTLINMSPGRWYPIRLSRMKGVFQFKLLCWHFSLFGKCVYALGANMHDCL